MATATTQPFLLREDANGVTTLTMNRPAARNSLSGDMLDALQHEFERIGDDESVRVVIIGAIGPAFCAGHDMKQLRANPDEAYYKLLFGKSSRLMQTIIASPKPVIARVQAIATAAGCQLVASCDLAVAAHSAKFATPGVNIGLFCSTPLVALSRNIGRKHAMEMLLTGDAIDAGTAVELGLINRTVPDSDLEAETLSLAEQIASKSPLTIAIGKRAFYDQLDLDLADAYTVAAEAMTRNMLAHDAEEGIDAFLEKRSPTWQGR